MQKKIVLSGIRPTGHVHLGNYLGSIRNFVKMQNEPNYECYYFIADYHALTTHLSGIENLKQNVLDALAIYLGCGVSPEKATIYVQSHVPEIPELYLLFNMLAHKGELEKCPTFKEKVRNQEQSGKSISAGLLTYPVLMATDIIIHRAHLVPVGKDQEPHLEMARNFVSRFNQLTKSTFFPEPQAFSYTNELIKVPSLDGTGKMSKSAENPNSSILITDEDSVIRKKIMKATTDTGPTEPNQTKPEIIQNIFDLMELVSTPDTIQFFDNQYNNCTIRYGDLKKQLAEDMVKTVAPIRENIKLVAHDTVFIKKVMQHGAEKARESAQNTLQGVKELLQMIY